MAVKPTISCLTAISENRSVAPVLAVVRLLADGLEAQGPAEVRVPFEERDQVNFLFERTVVLEDVEAVPEVDYVDQPVLDDRVAPHHDLLETPCVGIGGKPRMLQGNHVE